MTPVVGPRDVKNWRTLNSIKNQIALKCHYIHQSVSFCLSNFFDKNFFFLPEFPRTINNSFDLVKVFLPTRFLGRKKKLSLVKSLSSHQSIPLDFLLFFEPRINFFTQIRQKPNQNFILSRI